MTPLWGKLGLKTQRSVQVLDAPPSFEAELAALQATPGLQVARGIGGRHGPTGLALAFVTTTAQRDAASRAMAEAAEGDALLWLAYPKRTSKRYRCEFDRDSGWAVLGAAGYEPVRIVAIDEDWSALRFRHVDHIGTMTRDPSRAQSAPGRQRALASAKAPPQRRGGAGG